MRFSEIEKILSSKSVGIAGAGGLGSNCAAALVRCGIGRLTLVDYDRVDLSNLNRQFYFADQIGQFKVQALEENLIRINPNIKIRCITEKITPENIPAFFEDVDLIVEAFDLADQKVMLIEAVMATWPHKPLIAGSGMAGFGLLDRLVIRQSGNLYICGDGETEISDNQPPIAPRVGIVANMQADKAIELLLQQDEKEP